VTINFRKGKIVTKGNGVSNNKTKISKFYSPTRNTLSKNYVPVYDHYCYIKTGRPCLLKANRETIGKKPGVAQRVPGS